MLVKDVKDSSNRVSLGLKCGECMHLTGVATFEKPCAQLGKTSFAEACPSFTPDMRILAVVKKKHHSTLAEIFKELSQPQLRLLGYACRNADLVKKSGFELGEEVVFSLGQDYLECYVRGYVIGADRAATQVYISSDFEGLNGGSCLITLLRPSVMKMADFLKHRAELISKGRIAEPKPSTGSVKRTTLQCLRMSPDARALLRKQLKTKPDEYTPPSLDTVPSSWLDGRMLEKVVMSKAEAKKTGTRKTTGNKDGGYTLKRYADAAGKKGRPTVKRKG
jgi:hypothetical protein